jgi:hypothetical protein
VPKEKKFGGIGDPVAGQRRPRQLDHRADREIEGDALRGGDLGQDRLGLVADQVHPFRARINFAGAHKDGGCGTGVTRVHQFIRATKVDPRHSWGHRADRGRTAQVST